MLAVAAVLLLTLAPTVINQNPSPGAHLRTFYPSFSATIQPKGGVALRRSTVHLFVDGNDVTAQSSMNGNTISYMPRGRMNSGWHDVFLEGTDVQNHAFNKSWVFQSEAPDGMTPTQTSQFIFFPSGGVGFFPGDFVHFVVIAPIGGAGFLQVCGFGQFAFTQFPGSPVFFTTLPGTIGGINPFLGCQVTALFTPLGGFGSVLLPLPLPVPIGIAGPGIAAQQHAAPSARNVVPVYRGTEPAVPRVAPAHAVVTAPRNAMPVARAAPAQGVQVIYGIPPPAALPAQRAMPPVQRGMAPVQRAMPAVRPGMPVQAMPGRAGSVYPAPYSPVVYPGLGAPGVPVIGGTRTVLPSVRTAPVIRAAPPATHSMRVPQPVIAIPHHP